MMSLIFLIITLLFVQLESSEQTIILPKYFTIPVLTAREYSPDIVKIGTRVEVKISQDIIWKNFLVFKEGTPVDAIVIEAHDTGILGKSSLIVIDIKSTIAIDGTIVPLKGSIKAEGKDRSMEAVGAAVGVCCLGVFIPGERQSIGKGVGTIAFTKEEVKIKCIRE